MQSAAAASHAKGPVVPSWVALSVNPPPGPFDVSALDTIVEETYDPSTKARVTALIGAFPAERRDDFLAGTHCSAAPPPLTLPHSCPVAAPLSGLHALPRCQFKIPSSCNFKSCYHMHSRSLRAPLPTTQSISRVHACCR